MTRQQPPIGTTYTWLRGAGASQRGGLGWTCPPTPLLPEVVLEIDANPVSFYSGWGFEGAGHGVCKIRRMMHICCFCWAPKSKRFSYSGAFPPDPLTRGSACRPRWGSAPRPLLQACAPLTRHACPPHIFGRPCAPAHQSRLRTVCTARPCTV